MKPGPGTLASARGPRLRILALFLAGAGCLVFLGLFLRAEVDLTRQDRAAFAAAQGQVRAVHDLALGYYRLRSAVADYPRLSAAARDDAVPPSGELLLSELAPAAGPDGAAPLPATAEDAAHAYARIVAELAALRQNLERLTQIAPGQALPETSQVVAALGRALTRVEALLPPLQQGVPGTAGRIAAVLRQLEPDIEGYAGAAMERAQAMRPSAAGTGRPLGLYLVPALVLGLTFLLLLGGELSGRRRLSEAALRRQQRASDESAAKTVFLATVSHEVRTPLNAISGFAELIQRQPFGPVGHQKYLEYTQDIIASTTHLRGLLDDVTDAQLVLDGQISLQEEAVRLRSFLAETLRIVRANCAGRYLPPRIVTRVAGVTLRADRRRLRQVLINLLTNSIRYSEGQAQITITAALKGDALEIAVEDRGVGIPQDLLDRVFEPFQRGSHSGESGRTGMGLGLTIVRNIVQAHGGTVAIDSTAGQGTTVTLRLPADRLVRDRPVLPSRLHGIAAE